MIVGGEIFDSATRSAGDLAGVFEYDAEVGYFYLYETEAEDGRRILDHISVLSGAPDFDQQDVSIRWNAKEDKVGLFIRSQLWAVLDSAKRSKYGGHYRPGTSPLIPVGVAAEF